MEGRRARKKLLGEPVKNYDTTIVLASVSPYMAERVNFILQGTMAKTFRRLLWTAPNWDNYLTGFILNKTYFVLQTG